MPSKPKTNGENSVLALLCLLLFAILVILVLYDTRCMMPPTFVNEAVWPVATVTSRENHLIALNSADAGKLIELPGIGPVLAAAIVDYRVRHGRFESIDELLEVKGMGPAKLEQIRPAIILD